VRKARNADAASAAHSSSEAPGLPGRLQQATVGAAGGYYDGELDVATADMVVDLG
jgi:hypothetical protein